MKERESRHPFKVLLGKYIPEILVIFIGISISFFFDEWRDNRKDDEIVKKHLIALREGLVKDTLNLTVMINHGTKLVRGINKLTYSKLDSQIKDSVDLYIDYAASYLVFKSNQMAYEEIRQTAHTSLIKNDSLKTSFLAYYTSVIPYSSEWSKVDETHTMTQLIPEMSIYFPVVPDSLNVISSQEKVKKIKTKKLRNLLLANATYKKETVQAFIITKKASVNLLRRVDGELKK